MILYSDQTDKLNTYLFSKNRKKELRSDDIICFDIETTSLWKIDGSYKAFSLDIPECKYRDTEYMSFPYIWQCSINDTVYYGRDFDDVRKIFTMINSQSVKVVIWVHNLSYEFEFLKNIFTVDTVFAKKAHAIMKCTFKELPYIEFRCSYMLTRLSLDDWAKQVGKVNKKVGQLDYNVYRSPYTPMTEKELEYCEYDCICMYYGLLEYVKKYGHVHKIPLTQTGEIRLIVKKMMDENKYNRIATRIQPDTTEEYQILINAFSGGETHANYLNAGTVLNNVASRDFSSSYPFSMVTQKYPRSKFMPKIYEQNDRFLYILYIRLKDVRSKNTLTYIHESKCIRVKGASLDNGRILNADELEIYVTSIDFEIIKQMYYIGEIEIIESYGALCSYMPKEFITLILQKYADKTTLKGMDGMQGLYLQAKQFVNGIFGMSCTKIIQPDVIYNQNNDIEWSVAMKTENEINELLKKNKKHYAKNFLPYSFGVFVTAYSRKMLMDVILSMPYEDIVYYDTDSVKFLNMKKNMKYIEKKNEENLHLLENIFNMFNIDKSLFAPCDSKGNKHIMGQMENDVDNGKVYDVFKTLGAKRYYYEEDGEKHITIAGVPKNAVKYIDSVSDFNEDLRFPAYLDGKKILQYNNEQELGIRFPDGYISKYKSGVAIRPCSTNLTITDEYLSLIGRC